MKSISEITYKVVAYSEIEELPAEECIDWAMEMIEGGHDTPSLIMLACIEKPANYFETIEYLKKAIFELGLKEKIGEEAVISYSYFYVKRIADNINIKHNLRMLYSFYQDLEEHRSSIYDFCLLHWAWDQLDYDDIGFNHYWEGATNKNIEQIIIEVAQKWIEKNQTFYHQPPLC